MLRGTRAAVLATSLACAAASAALVLPTEPRASHRLLALSVALDTAASLIALLAAFLVAGRFARRTLLNELMLVCALTVFALSDLFFGTLPVLGGFANTGLTARASLAGSMLGALLFALAAYVPAVKVRGSGLGQGLAAVAVTVTPVLALAAVLMLPEPEVVMAVLYGLASIGFLTRSKQRGEEFLAWLAIAAVLATAARIDYSVYPALDSDSAYIQGIFRLLFYTVLLAGSLREMGSYWRALSDAAVRQERRRVARDLHDGLTQELAYLARNLDQLAGTASAETVERLRRAVERAQTESRRAIHALAAPAAAVFDRTLETRLAEAANEIAERFNIELAFDSVPDVRLSQDRAEALVRIACEALTNAARHSGTSVVRLTLTRDGQRVRLCVSDAGRGFDPDATGDGFGLTSLRERASSVGGELRITSIPGRGSEVEAVF